MSREDAYEVVQRNAHSALNTNGGDFRANLQGDPEVSNKLNADQLAECFSTQLHQANLGVVWDRLGLLVNVLDSLCRLDLRGGERQRDAAHHRAGASP